MHHRHIQHLGAVVEQIRQIHGHHAVPTVQYRPFPKGIEGIFITQANNQAFEFIHGLLWVAEQANAIFHFFDAKTRPRFNQSIACGLNAVNANINMNKMAS